MTAHGGDTYSFDSTFDVDIFTAAAKVAIPAGPARIYGLVGANFHQSTITLTETDRQRHAGLRPEDARLGYLFGGGTEIWVTPKVALYGEAEPRARSRARRRTKAKWLIDDRLRFLGFGVKVRLSR